MLQMRSKVKVIDNSGVSRVRCIKVLGSSTRRIAKMGDIVIASVIQLYPNKYTLKSNRLKMGSVVRGLVVRTQCVFTRLNGFYYRFYDNAIILVTKKNNPYGTRFYGPVLKELCTKYLFLGSMTRYII